MAQRRALEVENAKRDNQLHEISSRLKHSDENARKQVDQVIRSLFTLYAVSVALPSPRMPGCPEGMMQLLLQRAHERLPFPTPVLFRRVYLTGLKRL